MPRPAGALAVALAAAVFALAFVAPSPVEAQVTVDVTCPSEQNPQLVVTVEPWVYEVEEGDPGEWILSIEDDIEIETIMWNSRPQREPASGVRTATSRSGTWIRTSIGPVP